LFWHTENIFWFDKKKKKKKTFFLFLKNKNFNKKKKKKKKKKKRKPFIKKFLMTISITCYIFNMWHFLSIFMLKNIINFVISKSSRNSNKTAYIVGFFLRTVSIGRWIYFLHNWLRFESLSLLNACAGDSSDIPVFFFFMH
jgi:hypothetical protein